MRAITLGPPCSKLGDLVIIVNSRTRMSNLKSAWGLAYMQRGNSEWKKLEMIQFEERMRVHLLAAREFRVEKVHHHAFAACHLPQEISLLNLEKLFCSKLKLFD